MSLTLEDVKAIAETFQATMTGVALLAGGVWTYLLFVRNREGVPRLSMDLKIETEESPFGDRLIQVRVELTNSGRTLVRVREFFCRIYQVRPVHPDTLKDRIVVGSALSPPPGDDKAEAVERQIRWHRLDEYVVQLAEKSQFEIEPGEVEILPFDFKVPGHVQVIEVYSYVQNEAKKSIGWQRATRFSLCEAGEQRHPSGATAATEPARPAGSFATTLSGQVAPPVPTAHPRAAGSPSDLVEESHVGDGV